MKLTNHQQQVCNLNYTALDLQDKQGQDGAGEIVWGTIKNIYRRRLLLDCKYWAWGWWDLLILRSKLWKHCSPIIAAIISSLSPQPPATNSWQTPLQTTDKKYFILSYSWIFSKFFVLPYFVKLFSEKNMEL